MQTAEEQNREHRIALERAKYPNEDVDIVETDHWFGLSATQIFSMKRRGRLPPQYTYEIIHRKEEGA